MRKVTLILDTPEWDIHFGTCLEILQEEILAGSECHVLICDADVSACETNYEHAPEQCSNCIDRREQGLQQIEGSFERHRFAQYYGEISLKEWQELRRKLTLDPREFKKLRTRNFDIGEAVLSSISSRYAREWPDLSVFRDLTERFLFSSFLAYHSMRVYLRGRKDHVVYLFNGRLALQRGYLRAIQEAQISYVLHERGRNKDHYKLYHNFSPHSLLGVEDDIRKAWREADPKKREETAAAWFTALAKGIPQAFVSFISGQDFAQMPDDWDPSKENIVIFTSAEFEYNMFGEEWAHHIYRNQIEGVTRIAADFCNDTTRHFYVRIHPSLKNKPWETDELLALRQHNFTVIGPESRFSSYRLLMAAQKILVFVSTIGIEAVFWGKAVIVASRCQYQNLGSTYNANSHEEVVSLLRQSLIPKNKEGALQFGYYYATLGQPFRFYQASDLFAGTFKGHAFVSSVKTRCWRQVRIRVPRLYRLLSRIFRLKGALRIAFKWHSRISRLS